MDVASFRASVSGNSPPEGVKGPLAAMWHAAKGEWQKAHDIVKDDESDAAAWVHAHLHRVEGDQSNAEYWYRRAGKPVSELPVDQEWTEVASAMVLRM